MFGEGVFRDMRAIDDGVGVWKHCARIGSLSIVYLHPLNTSILGLSSFPDHGNLNAILIWVRDQTP